MGLSTCPRVLPIRDRRHPRCHGLRAARCHAAILLERAGTPCRWKDLHPLPRPWSVGHGVLRQWNKTFPMIKIKPREFVDEGSNTHRLGGGTQGVGRNRGPHHRFLNSIVAVDEVIGPLVFLLLPIEISSPKQMPGRTVPSASTRARARFSSSRSTIQAKIGSENPARQSVPEPRWSNARSGQIR